MQEVDPPDYSEITFVPENNNFWDDLYFHDWVLILSITLFILGIFLFKKNRVEFITSFFSIFFILCINNILVIVFNSFYDPQWFRFEMDFWEIFYSYGSMILAYPISVIYTLLQIRTNDHRHKQNLILYILPIFIFLGREYIFFSHLVPSETNTMEVWMTNDSFTFLIFQLLSINHWFPIWYSGMFEHEFAVFYNFKFFYLMEVIVTPLHLAFLIFICQRINKMTAIIPYVDKSNFNS